MGLLTLIFLICALRTNVAFFLLFFTLLVGVLLLTGAFFLNADDIVANAAMAKRLTVVSMQELTRNGTILTLYDRAQAQRFLHVHLLDGGYLLL